MIEMDMALETELGVDSIKRVEILSDCRRSSEIEAQDVAAPRARRPSARSSTDDQGARRCGRRMGKSPPRRYRRPPLPPRRRACRRRRRRHVVLAVLAAKTGYEPDMIEMDMALERSSASTRSSVR